ncbi:MAG: adaptor protein MecA [Lachnospiraceae bacterium]|nr:adaptor protein MecA [Lachnospiraceae bacterium]
MKIEKVNDNQIRCTLTKEDLADRELKISEIAYGSEKARNLFRDVMQQASYEYGFEAENIPLMIEAVPMSSGCVVFIITKVEDPEELDTRFSKFAPSIHSNEEDILDEEEEEEGDLAPNVPGAISEVFDLFKRITSQVSEAAQRKLDSQKNNSEEAAAPSKPESDTKLFSFKDMDTLAKACKVIDSIYTGASGLYKNPANGYYYLLLFRDGFPSKDFVRVGNLLLEYATPEKCGPSILAYIDEHYDTLVIKDAVHAMAQI